MSAMLFEFPDSPTVGSKAFIWCWCGVDVVLSLFVGVVLLCKIYRQVSNIRRTLVGNKIVDNSDVVGASPVGAAPTTSELST